MKGSWPTLIGTSNAPHQRRRATVSDRGARSHLCGTSGRHRPCLCVAVILVAIGLTIIFGLLDVINMSHGEFYAFGGVRRARAGLARRPGCCWSWCRWRCLLVGYAVERVLIQRVFNRPGHVTTLLPTFGSGWCSRTPSGSASAQSPPGNADFRRGRAVRHLHSEPPPVPDRRRDRDRGCCARGLPHQARDGARRRLRPQHGGVARCRWRGSTPAPLRSAYLAGGLRGGARPRRSIPLFPTMGRDFILMAFTVVIVGGMRGASPAPSWRACSSPRCRRSPRSTSRRCGPIRSCSGSWS